MSVAMKPMELTEQNRGRSGVIARARTGGGHETPPEAALAEARRLAEVVAELQALESMDEGGVWDPSPDDM